MFDLDGTVADTCADLAGAVNHVRAEHGLAALPVATVTSLLGNGLKDLTTRTFTDAPPIVVDAVTERAKLKPDPEPLITALKETGCDAAQSWIIGDNWTDLGAAANAGVKACFCTYGYGSKRDYAVDVEIASFRELEKILLTTEQA